MSYRFDLDFREAKSGPPIARIVLKSSGGRTEEGGILVTPAMNVSMAELDSAIDGLVRDLEELREQAREEFLAAE